MLVVLLYEKHCAVRPSLGICIIKRTLYFQNVIISTPDRSRLRRVVSVLVCS